MPQKIDFEPIQFEPIQFEPIQFEPIKQQSTWEKLTTPTTVNIPENVTGWKRLPGEFYNKFISPMSTIQGAGLTGLLAGFGGPLAAQFPRIAAGATGLFGGASALQGINAAEDMYNNGINPSNSLDLIGGAVGSLGLPIANRMIGKMNSSANVTNPFSKLLYGDVPSRGYGPYQASQRIAGLLPGNVPQQAEASSGIRGLLSGNVQPQMGPFQQRMLPGPQSPAGLLPAMGESTASGVNTAPRFYQGISGTADTNMAYPFQLQSAGMPQNAGPIAFNATEQIPGGRLASVTLRRPEITTPDIGAELSAGRHILQDADPIVENPVMQSLIPQRYAQPNQIPITPPMVSKPFVNPNQITYPPTQNPPSPQVLPQYRREIPRASGIRTNPFQVLPQYRSEMPRAVSKLPSAVNPQNPFRVNTLLPDEAAAFRPAQGPQPRPYPNQYGANAILDVTGMPVGQAPREVINPKTGKPVGKLTQVIGLGKEIAASIDLSAPLRQGINLVHKKEWRDAIVPMIKSWKSEGNFQALEQSIKANPHYELGQKSGLSITDRVSAPEEQFISTLAEKIPYLGEAFKASNRGYTGFLNKLRQDTFSSLVNAAEKAEPGITNDMTRMKEIATYVNNATGRGSLGRFEKNSELLNNLFFSPRFVSSRIQMMNPVNYMKTSPQIRKEYLKSFLATSAFAGTTLGLAALSGADVNVSDPTSSDFLKAKFGNTRLDPWGGYQQYLVAGSRMLDFASALASGNTKGYGAFQKPTAAETLSRFTEGKLNPVMAFGWAAMNGREFNGTPFEVKNSIVQHFTPMVMKDLVELWRDDPTLIGLGAPATFGMSVQTYKPKNQNSMLSSR